MELIKECPNCKVEVKWIRRFRGWQCPKCRKFYCQHELETSVLDD